MIVNFPNLRTMSWFVGHRDAWNYGLASAHAENGNYDAAVRVLSIASWRAGIECDSWSS